MFDKNIFKIFRHFWLKFRKMLQQSVNTFQIERGYRLALKSQYPNSKCNVNLCQRMWNHDNILTSLTYNITQSKQHHTISNLPDTHFSENIPLMLLVPAEFSSAKFIALFFNVLKLSGSGIWTAILIRYFDHPGGNV